MPNDNRFVYVLTKDIMDEDNPDQLSYTDVIGVTENSVTAKAWSSGESHRVVRCQVEDLNLAGHESADI